MAASSRVNEPFSIKFGDIGLEFFSGVVRAIKRVAVLSINLSHKCLRFEPTKIGSAKLQLGDLLVHFLEFRVSLSVVCLPQ